MRRNRRAILAVLLTAALLAAVPAGAEMIFDGTVTGGETISVLAPFGGIVDDVAVQAGDRVKLGERIATIQTTRVYASTDGTVAGVFGEEGDDTEGITERYGAVLYLEPVNKYTISASTEKAYNRSENKFIHIGEHVYMICAADGTHQGTGIVTKIEEEGKYTVEVNAGEFMLEETVNIFRKSDYSASSRIGRGTVAAATPVAVKGSGSILKMHVKSGDQVERGELLFETVEGALDGLYSPGADIPATASGILASVDAGAGASVAKGGKIAAIYPDDSLQVEIPVAESDLGSIYVGMPVVVEFSWEPAVQMRFDGTVTHISYLNTAAEGESEPSYTACVAFTPDEHVRLGMTVLVYAQEATEDEAGPEATATPDGN